MKYRAFRRLLLIIGDVFLFFISLCFTLLIRQGSSLSFELYINFAKNFLWLFLFWLFLLFIFDFYSLKLKIGTFHFFRYLLIFIFLSFFSGILFFYFRPKIVIAPKTILILEIIIFNILFLGWRFFFEWAFKKNIKKEKIIFLGSSPEIEELVNYLKHFSSRYKVVGLYTEKSNTLEIKKVIREERVRRVIVADSSLLKRGKKNESITELKDLLFSSPYLKIESLIKFYEMATQRIPLSFLSNSDFLEEFYNEEERTYTILKKLFDVTFSFLGCIILAILYPFIAIAIKMDSQGPVFFTQKRLGRKKKPFRLYKFRTMVSSKEENEEWRTDKKKYVTRVGKILRVTHLDELPQLLNILKGELSFMGPRPEWQKLTEVFENKIPFYFLRSQVKPGFTGWAQINLPPSFSANEAREKFQYDLYYIKHRSFLFDMVIFLKSLRKVFG